MPTILEMLKQSTLFAALEEEFQQEIAALGRRRRVAAGQVIFLQGDPGDGLYGVLEGRVHIVAESSGGRERLLNVLLPGELFGEIALMDGGTRSASALAADDGALIFIDRGAFAALLQRHPQLATRILGLVCARVRWLSGLVEDAAFLSGSERLAKRLLGLRRALDPASEGCPELRVSQAELARFVGLSRQSVNQQLKRWEAAGHLELSRGAIRVRDVESLEALARPVAVA